MNHKIVALLAGLGALGALASVLPQAPVAFLLLVGLAVLALGPDFLISPAQIDSDISPSRPLDAHFKFTVLFEAFSNRVPSWHAPDATLFWDLPAWSGFDKEGFLITSLQDYGTSSLHAPVVLHHYLNVAWSGVASWNHIDLAHFLSHPANEPVRWLFLEGHADSQDVFQRISGTSRSDMALFLIPTRDNAALHQMMADSVARAFDQYGPGFIRTMGIEDGFMDASVVSHLAVPDHINFMDNKRNDRSHAMVLIGRRIDGLLLGGVLCAS
jgi:hypothetical protein